MQIRTKFYLGYIPILLLIIATGVFSVTSTTTASQNAKDVQAHIQTVETLFQMKTVADRAAQEMISAAFATYLEADSGEPGFAEEEIEELVEAAQELDALFARYQALEAALGDEEEEIVAIGAAIAGMQATGQVLLAALASNDPDAIEAVLLDAETSTETFTEAINNALIPDIAEQNELAQAVTDSATTAVPVTTIVFSMLAIMIGSAGFLFVRSIARPVQSLQRAAQEVTRGNYSYRTQSPGRDEVGQAAQAFNTMAATIQERDMALSDLNASLEQRVVERTKALEAAIAVAEENTRVKSQFLANMSHELRTPLNAIMGFTGIMLEGMGGDIDSDAQYMIRRIQSNSTRLLELINSVLDLAKIEAGRIEIISAPFSPRELAASWQAEAGVLAVQKKLTLDVDIDPDLPDLLLGDDARLTQIAMNLLSNAVKFTAKGGVRLNLSAKDDKWTIQVTDTGIGIPPHAINYIFEEFRQVDGSTTRMYGGSGLGLAIVRNLCLMMDGTVRVTSQVGKGSTFTVTLPLRPVAEQAELMEA